MKFSFGMAYFQGELLLLRSCRWSFFFPVCCWEFRLLRHLAIQIPSTHGHQGEFIIWLGWTFANEWNLQIPCHKNSSGGWIADSHTLMNSFYGAKNSDCFNSENGFLSFHSAQTVSGKSPHETFWGLLMKETLNIFSSTPWRTLPPFTKSDTEKRRLQTSISLGEKYMANIKPLKGSLSI